MEDQEKIYDYIFIGIGASNSLLLLALLKNGLLQNKKVAIIEPNTKRLNDKTYCFWAGKNEPIVDDLKEITKVKYTQTTVLNKVENIENQPYFQVRSIDLYDYIRSIIEANNFTSFGEEVLSLEKEENLIKLKTSTSYYWGHQIFDSKPTITSSLQKKDVFLLQSFYGLHVRLTEPLLNSEVFEMMDFDVDQDKFTQFVYTLPYSNQEALLEITRFGSEPIPLDYAQEKLKAFIKQKHGSFEILADEIGCIPMTTYRHKPSNINGLLKTGISANLIKPSTGYGFKNMYNFAQNVVEELKKPNVTSINAVTTKNASRFKFYDHILLIILLNWPNWGKKIFSSLLKKQDFSTILTFLDEKTSLKDEVRIFAQLPLIPFFKALFTYIGYFVKKRHLVVTGLLLVSLIFQNVFPLDATNLHFVILILGLVTVGIPHGAVDHILLKRENFNLIKFVVQYVAIIITYFVMWQILPFFSLILFMLYSAFHFGESELINLKTSKLALKVLSFFVGASILLYIIVAHVEESAALLSNLKGLEFFKDYVATVLKLQLAILTLCIGFLVAIALILKRINLFFLIFLLTLGSFLPLLFHFGFYFIGQHSLNAWEHIKERKSLRDRALYQKAAPFTIAAFSFLLIYFFVLLKFSEIEFLSVHFFVFLACISLPHVVLMHLFYREAE